MISDDDNDEKQESDNDINDDINDEEKKYDEENEILYIITGNNKKTDEKDKFIEEKISSIMSADEIKETGFRSCLYSITPEVIIYVTLILIVFAVFIWYFNVDSDQQKFGILLLMVIATEIGSITGILTIYNGNNVRVQGEEVQKNNLVYAGELGQLREENVKLRDNMDKFGKINGILKDEEQKIKKSVDDFDKIMGEINKAKEKWEELDKILTDCNNINDILKEIQRNKNKASIYEIFHRSDKKNDGLTEQEFNAFFDDLGKEEREKLKLKGYDKFEKWDVAKKDGLISTHEFEKVISENLLFTNKPKK